jgi:hypothetical protein
MTVLFEILQKVIYKGKNGNCEAIFICYKDDKYETAQIKIFSGLKRRVTKTIKATKLMPV